MPVSVASKAALVLAALLTAAMPVVASAESGGSIVKIGPTRPAGGDSGAAGDTARPAKPSAARSAPKDCVGNYLQALQTIRRTEFAALSGKPGEASAGNPSLPGMLVFTPKPAPRSRTEMAALAAAAALAKGRGRQTQGADARWVAERLRSDLSDYLGQKATPYLCGGVPQYIETLRRFSARAGSDPQRLQTLLQAQEAAARRSVETAFAALKPVATPRFAPTDRPADSTGRPTEALDGTPTSGLDTAPTGAITGLRPSAGLSRAETSPPAAIAGPAPADPDLPPLKPTPPRSLATPAERAAAIDALLAETRRAGFLAPAPATAADEASADGAAASPAGEPVIQHLLAARAALRSDPMSKGQESVRLMLASAFADIEALDYLQRAAAEKGDPQSRAVSATFDAILAAQEKECTCGG